MPSAPHAIHSSCAVSLSGADMAGIGAAAQEKEERQRKKARLAARSKLSFAEEEDGDGEDGENGERTAVRACAVVTHLASKRA